MVLKAMKNEIVYYSKHFKEKINSIYFGGGTPSILDEAEFESIVDCINENFETSELNEFTLECNPEDLKSNKMNCWKSKGVNRLSIGVQTFQNKILKSINRQHTKEIAIHGVRAAKELFDQLSLDLIVGLPGMDLDDLKEDVNLLLSLDPEHVSAYQLSVEDKTQLAFQVKKGEVNLISDEAINDQYKFIHKRLSENEYGHYEVSNYSKNGMEAIHNSSYWSGEAYLGIGPGAHSYFGNKRRWNISNNIKYALNLENGETWFEEEELSLKDRFNETIMISLRTKKGLSITKLREDFPDFISEEMLEKINEWELKGWATHTQGSLSLSIEGWLISDQLASDLFVI